ncbi:MAG: Isochorismatase hydrolase [Acidimicrobiales bacterium]|nr:Isochorismatase hydrolase [Acidimicrobiales bacterium]
MTLTGRQITSPTMPIDLAELLQPGRTAVVTSEVQQSVVGERSVLPELAEAAGALVVPNIARLCRAARAADVSVVHCTAARRADGKGSNTNSRLFLGVRRSPVTMLPGSPEVQVVPELGPEPGDLVLTRLHGLNPMAGTDLDPVLRNLGISTLVVTGVSVNVAITNLVMDAVNHGYQVVLPRDAVAGLPASYAEALIDNTLALLATVTTTDEVIAAWGRPADPGGSG